jgi:hypothetical protein
MAIAPSSQVCGGKSIWRFLAGAHRFLSDLGQIRASGAAQIIALVGDFPRTVGRDVIGPIEELGVDPVPLGQTVEVVATESAAFVAFGIVAPRIEQ